MATKKVILRTFKLFLLGLLLQGGYFHGRHDLTYGVDVGKIRWMGVLQRISIGYLFAAMSEIWLVDRITVDSPMAFVKKYYIQWMVAFLFCTFYMCLLYGLYVPDWEFEVPITNLFGYEFAGGSGLALTIIFYIVDVKHFRKPTMILQWMGMNALIIYALAACDLFPAAIQGFYWGSPENNLVDDTESLFQVMLHSKKWGTLVFVIVEILFWGLVAGFLHLKGIYVRL